MGTATANALLAVLAFTTVHADKHAALPHKVHCSADQMRIELLKSDAVTAIYLERLKHYPDAACQPVADGQLVTLSLSLKDIYKCMVTKVANKGTGRTVYYHHLVVEFSDKPKEAILVKCDSDAIHKKHSQDSNATDAKSLYRREARPQFENFKEDEEVEITGEVTGHAPTPELSVGVTQNNLLIDDELTVKPGTPLEMNIALDSTSADIYGVMVSNMEVTDTQQQQEALILNGCTVDPFLFENFATSDGDRLSAKFKAFKFPESNFVLFKGTVNVCLDKCQGVTCANGQIGFGRRRRDVAATKSAGADPNKVYEVSMSTVVRVEGDPVDGKDQKVWLEKATLREVYHPDEVAIAALSEEFAAYKYVDFQDDASAGALTAMSASIVVVAVTIVMLLL